MHFQRFHTIWGLFKKIENFQNFRARKPQNPRIKYNQARKGCKGGPLRILAAVKSEKYFRIFPDISYPPSDPKFCVESI